MRLVRSDVLGLTLRDRDGRTIGTVVDFYDYPAGCGGYWGVATVASQHRILRLRGTRRLVDLTNAQLHGPTVVAAHTLAAVRAAPRVRCDTSLAREQATVLIAHYWPGTTQPVA